MVGSAIGAVVGGGLSFLGSRQQADAAERAGDLQAAAAARAADIQQQQFQQTREDLAPFRLRGTDSLNRLNRLINDNDLSIFQESPGFRFRLREGQRALDRSAAARGRLNSGGQERRTQEFAQGLASQEFGNFVNRLSGLATMGQNSAAQTGTLGAQAAANTGQFMNFGGAAQAAGTVGAANAGAQGLSNLGFAVQQGIGNFQQNRLMNNLRNSSAMNPLPVGTTLSPPAGGVSGSIF